MSEVLAWERRIGFGHARRHDPARRDDGCVPVKVRAPGNPANRRNRDTEDRADYNGQVLSAAARRRIPERRENSIAVCRPRRR